MRSTIKLFIAFFTLSLAFVSLYTNATTCPPLDSIKRVSGEYQWVTTEPGWNGFFVAPTTGRGRSYKVKMFLNATWVKSYDTEDSSGFIQCDYIGDFGSKKRSSQQAINPASTASTGNGLTVSGQGKANNQQQAAVTSDTTEYEIIRFTQTNSNGSITPEGKFTWTCKAVTTFPSEACICYGSPEKCSFRMS